MTHLSRNQAETLDFVAGYIERRGCPPTLREVAEATDLAGPTSAHNVVGQLEELGRLRRVPGKARSLELVQPVERAGHIVVFRNLDTFLIAKIDLVRESHLTCFAWRIDQRCWAKGRIKVRRDQVTAYLPANANPIELGEAINALKNRRDARRMAADRDFRAAVARIATGTGGKADG